MDALFVTFPGVPTRENVPADPVVIRADLVMGMQQGPRGAQVVCRGGTSPHIFHVGVTVAEVKERLEELLSKQIAPEILARVEPQMRLQAAEIVQGALEGMVKDAFEAITARMDTQIREITGSVLEELLGREAGEGAEPGKKQGKGKKQQ